jgi:hypothetical protein
LVDVVIMKCLTMRWWRAVPANKSFMWDTSVVSKLDLVREAGSSPREQRIWRVLAGSNKQIFAEMAEAPLRDVKPAVLAQSDATAV